MNTHDRILKVMLELACIKDYNHITRNEIAMNADCNPSLVSYYFGCRMTRNKIILKEGIKRDISAIVLRGLLNRDPVAMKAPKTVIKKAQKYGASQCESIASNLNEFGQVN